jgi:hypothetical protein
MILSFQLAQKNNPRTLHLLPVIIGPKIEWGNLFMESQWAGGYNHRKEILRNDG